MRPWHFILIGIVAAVGLYLAGWWTYTRVLYARGQALVAQTVGYSQSPDNPRLRMLVVGDSGAMGVGADRPEESIIGRIGTDAPDILIQNDAVSGRETHELAPLMATYETDSFDVVFVEIGGNDIIGFNSLRRVEASMRTTLTEAQRIAPIVLFTTNGNFRTTPALPPGFRWVWEWRAKQVRTLYEELSKEYDIPLMNYFVRLKELRDVNWLETHAVDRFHLSSYGYERGYESLRPLLVELGIVE